MGRNDVAISDILQRTELVFQRYKQFADTDPEKPDIKQLKKGKNAFDNIFERAHADVQAMQERVDHVNGPNGPRGPDRATAKSKLRKDCESALDPKLGPIAELRKLVKKGANTPGVVQERGASIDALEQQVLQIQADCGMGQRNRLKPTAPGPSGSKLGPAISAPRFDNVNPDAYKHTEQSRAFADDWEAAKEGQDQQLDRIAEGVGNLKHIAGTMADEMQNQEPLVGQIEVQMDDNINLLKNNNRRMAEQLHQVASTRNFCIDVTLILILLGIGGYVYSVLK